MGQGPAHGLILQKNNSELLLKDRMISEEILIILALFTCKVETEGGAILL